MKGQDNGIYLSRRTVYITIVVSLSLNAFFLLMGILIGKDDTKWDQGKISQPTTQADNSEPSKPDTIDSELAIFQPEDDSTPPKPLDLKPLDNPKPKVQTNSQPEKPAPTQTKTTQPKPKPKKSPTAQAVGQLSSGFWVQVLAIEEHVKARDFKDKVAKLGYPAVIISEPPFYKVLVGPHAKRDDAKRAQEQINSRFKTKAWIRSH